MGDAGEGLIDAESRIQERLEEIEQSRAEKRDRKAPNPEAAQAVETLRLAQVELRNQLGATTHQNRRTQISAALAEIERRIGVAERATVAKPK